MLAPRGYSVAITRIPLASTEGIYRITGRKGESSYVLGTPVLNVVDGVLRSVTVYKGKGKKSVRIPAGRVSPLGISIFSTDADRLTFAALTR